MTLDVILPSSGTTTMAENDSVAPPTPSPPPRPDDDDDEVDGEGDKDRLSVPPPPPPHPPLPRPPTRSEVLACRFSSWYPNFSDVDAGGRRRGVDEDSAEGERSSWERRRRGGRGRRRRRRTNVTLRSEIIDLPVPDFEEYLLSDGITLPAGAAGLSSCAPGGDDDRGGGRGRRRRRRRVVDVLVVLAVGDGRERERTRPSLRNNIGIGIGIGIGIDGLPSPTTIRFRRSEFSHRIVPNETGRVGGDT